MSFKTILVYLDDQNELDPRLSTACRIAEQGGAHVSALCLSLQVYNDYAASGDGFVTEFDVEKYETTREQASAGASAAKAKLADMGVSADTRWASYDSLGLTQIAASQARRADLAIASQPVAGQYEALRNAVLDGVLFSSGRPMLLLPNDWRGTAPGSNVLVAWDGSKEASRAINDALPFIDNAAATTVVIVDPNVRDNRFGEEPGAEIATALARHCSKTTLDRIPSSGRHISDALLTRAIDANADLIVMGGYGHSQLRETIFGGVSREMISKSTIPLLLSH